MTANEFLEQLEQSLSVMQPEERESAMSYYREYFMEAGEENEDDAAARLGSPQSVAERIIKESGEEIVEINENKELPENSAQSEKPVDGGRIALGVGVLLLGSPIWITILALWFALIVCIAAIPVSCGSMVIAAPVQAIVDLSSGNFGSGLADVGFGLAGAGVVMLTWLPVWMFIKFSWNTIKKFVLGIFGRSVK